MEQTPTADCLMPDILLKCPHLRVDFPDCTTQSNSMTQVTPPDFSVLFSSEHSQLGSYLRVAPRSQLYPWHLNSAQSIKDA